MSTHQNIIEFFDPKAAVNQLRNVALFASKDAARPIICGIHLTPRGNETVRATTTDSYALAWTDITVTKHTVPEDGILLGEDYVMNVVRKFKANDALCQLVSDDDWKTFGIGDGLSRWTTGYGDYPRVAPLIPTNTTADDDSVALPPVQLAKLTQLRLMDGKSAKAQPAVFWPGSTNLKPVRFRVTLTRIQGLIMPARIEDTKAPSWD